MANGPGVTPGLARPIPPTMRYLTLSSTLRMTPTGTALFARDIWIHATTGINDYRPRRFLFAGAQRHDEDSGISSSSQSVPDNQPGDEHGHTLAVSRRNCQTAPSTNAPNHTAMFSAQ